MTAGPGGTITLNLLEIGVSVFSCDSPAGAILLEPFGNRQRRGFSLLICNLNRPPDDLCLRDVPPSRQALKPFGSLFIKRETRSVHCSHHTIIICGNFCRDKRSGTLRRCPVVHQAPSITGGEMIRRCRRDCTVGTIVVSLHVTAATCSIARGLPVPDNARSEAGTEP